MSLPESNPSSALDFSPFTVDPVDLDTMAMLAVKEYKTFLSRLLECSTVQQVEQHVANNPECAKINHRLQFVLELQKKGIFETDPSKYTVQDIDHPLAKFISLRMVQHYLEFPPVATTPLELSEAALLGLIATEILGPVDTWLSNDILTNINPALIPSISSTVH